MSKFDKPFAEIKFYIPMDSDAWQDFRRSKVYASLMQSGLVLVRSESKQRRKTNDK